MQRPQIKQFLFFILKLPRFLKILQWIREKPKIRTVESF